MKVPERSAWRRSTVVRWCLVVLAALGLGSTSREHPWNSARPLRAAPAPNMRLASNEPKARPNRLLKEKSPYLLQHAYNPVDWYPWGDEALAKARSEDRPIFLSIGYSTCHWCHVMERESFENDSVAALLNRYFVAIKVDREERPDVDRLYMSAMNAMGLGGGWPLTVFLTPDLKPFFGGTYFPPGGSSASPGLLEVLPRVHQVFLERRPQIEAAGGQVMDALGSPNAPDSGSVERRRLFDLCYQQLAASYDSLHGGFGDHRKFPTIVNLNFLLRFWSHDPAHRGHAREMAFRQLDAMRRGGIHDHLGGGFHRYTTEAAWQVPHFEKMLYDQAQIAAAYLEAYQAGGSEEYAATARDVFTYVARDLSSPEGAFYSAEDADSEGEEGRFYVWTPGEIEEALGASDAALFDARYGVTSTGNFERGLTILHQAGTVEEVAKRFEVSPDEVRARLASARGRLLEARSRRVRPHRDDKVLTAWNGLMISAFARGSRVLGDDELRRQAERAADFVWRHLRDPRTGALMRRWRDGEAAAAGQLDDYAYFALGLIDLYGATLDPTWLERAIQLTEAEIARFWDEKDGGFFVTPANDPHLRVRLKEDYDGAEMAGVSIATFNLQLLANLLDRREWRDMASRTLDGYARRLARAPVAMPQMLVAMDLAQAPPRQIVIAGRPEAEDTRALLTEFNRRFLPRDQLLLVDGGDRQKRLAALAPFTEALVPKRGAATAYVCVHYACRQPTTEPASFAAELEASSTPKAPPSRGGR